MKRLHFGAYGVVWLLALLDPVAAEAAHEKTEPKGLSHFEVGAPNYKEIENQWSGAVDVTKWWVNKFAEERLRKDIDKLLQDAGKQAAPLIRWTGQGELFEIRVARDEHPNADDWFDAEIIGGSAFHAGHGATPEEAAFRYLSKDRLYPNLKPGFEYDPVYSGFIWFSRQPNGGIHCSTVPRGTTIDVLENIRSHYGDLESQYQLERMTRNNEWLQVARTAEAKLQDANARHAVEQAERQVEESQSRVREVNRRLKEALERESRANNAHNVLSALSTTLSVAGLAATVVSELHETPPGLDDAQSTADVVRVVDTYEDNQIRATKEIKIELKDATSDTQRSLDRLWESIQPAGPPPEIRDHLTLEVAPD